MDSMNMGWTTVTSGRHSKINPKKTTSKKKLSTSENDLSEDRYEHTLKELHSISYIKNRHMNHVRWKKKERASNMKTSKVSRKAYK